MSTLDYEVDGRIARITLDRPERGNAITLETPRELADCVERAKRLLFTGDLISGAQARDWGLAIEAPPAAELDQRYEELVQRIALTPVNQLVMMKLLVNQAHYAQGLHATQLLGTFFDGIARHTPEGYAFRARAREAGFRQAVRERDESYGD